MNDALRPQAIRVIEAHEFGLPIGEQVAVRAALDRWLESRGLKTQCNRTFGRPDHCHRQRKSVEAA